MDPTQVYVECPCNPGQYYPVTESKWICARCGTEQDTQPVQPNTPRYYPETIDHPTHRPGPQL